MPKFANSGPSASNFKSFSQSLEQFFLTEGQNNFGNKIPFPFEKNMNNSFSVTGWRVTSDFSLSIMEEDTAITITCNAISHGHYEDTLIKKDELTLTVLSK